MKDLVERIPTFFCLGMAGALIWRHTPLGDGPGPLLAAAVAFFVLPGFGRFMWEAYENFRVDSLPAAVRARRDVIDRGAAP